uniref:Quinone oxidoreductase-like protein 2 isoform X4 n=1 Tax=Pogona vitticeps TaxID=103695 RepID=A0ABM5G9G5_9SAUR
MPLDSGRQEARRVQTSGGALAPDAMARAGGLAGLRWCFEARSASRWMGCRRDAFSQIRLSPLALSSTILLHSQRHYRATLCTELTKPLIIGNIPSASLQPYEVRIRVHCCGVNFADILACQGLYQEKHPLPFTPGMEFSGDVMEAGKAVTRVKKGDRVIGVANTKALAEEYIADQKVIAGAGSEKKCSLAFQKGAIQSVNYSETSLREEVKKLTDAQGVNVVIDTIGGDIFKEALHSLAWEGRIVVVGFAGGTIPSIPANLLLLKNISALGLYWGRYRDQDFPVFSSALSSALSYCQAGRIQPHIGAVFKLEEVNEAFAHVTQRKSTGKVIISIS